MFKKLPDWKHINNKYFYKDGSLYFKNAETTWVKPGMKAGCTHKNTGYVSVSVLGQRYQAHRVIWKLLKKEEPNGEIDHINGDRADNRIENLRLIDKQKNLLNQKLYRNNKSGIHGVYFCKSKKKWCVQLTFKGVQKYYGSYELLEDAIAQRKKIQKEFEFHENHGRK